MAARPFTVLMTADTVGGVWHYALQLCRRLSGEHGMRVELATMGAPLTPRQHAEIAALEGVTLHEGSHRLEWMSDPWDDVSRAGQWLLSLEQRLAPDLVHLNQFAFGAVPFDAPTLLVAHSCVVSWWQAVHGDDPPQETWRRYRAVVRDGLAGADLVAAPTRDMLSSLVRNYGHDGGGIVLPNGRDAQCFPPGAKRPVIVSAGRLWDEAKNLQALERVAEALPWPIQVAGAAIDPDGKQRQMHAVRPLGELAVDRLAARLATAAIYAHPARYEPFGLAPLEAALAGCALVLGDLPSLRETWGDAAAYVPPEDHVALRETLLELIDNPARREALAERSRAVALRHSGAAMASGYAAAYRRLTEEIREEKQCAS